MRLLYAQQRINELLSQFVTQIKGSLAMSHTDICRASEVLLVPLLRQVYGFESLRSLNAELANHPAIDLADDQARVAIQVTATPESHKAQETLRLFLKHNLQQSYDRLLIYVLTEKQGSYAARPFVAIANGFDFVPKRDILDYTDILSIAANLSLERGSTIVRILDEHLGRGVPLLQITSPLPTERVYLNLLKVKFPDTIYLATLELAPKSQRRHRRRQPLEPLRKRVQQALLAKDLRFACDWEAYEDNLLTFHDLYDHALPLTSVIDQGTVEAFSPSEFYAIDENKRNVLRSLLRRCLQQKLYARGVQWQDKLHHFFFTSPDLKAERKEQWLGKREAERTVYEPVMDLKDPERVFCCKHLAFCVQFFEFSNEWFVSITPDWFFSHDGYRASRFGPGNISWLKRHEGNEQVLNHARFLAYFLSYNEPRTLFSSSVEYPFLSFAPLTSLEGAPALNDAEWKPSAENTNEEIPEQGLFVTE